MLGRTWGAYYFYPKSCLRQKYCTFYQNKFVTHFSSTTLILVVWVLPLIVIPESRSRQITPAVQHWCALLLLNAKQISHTKDSLLHSISYLKNENKIIIYAYALGNNLIPVFETFTPCMWMWNYILSKLLHKDHDKKAREILFERSSKRGSLHASKKSLIALWLELASQ